jgi:Mg2+ and Co2+ transporter CorA
MTLNMKKFRINALDLEADDEEGDSDDSDAEGESPAAIKKRHRREIERSERENRENTSALLELRDLEDELTTLQKLFDSQDSTIREMKEIYTSKDFKDTTKNGQDYLDEALEYLEDYKQQVSEMLKRVYTTRNDVRRP